jgi:hypothetical protein
MHIERRLVVDLRKRVAELEAQLGPAQAAPAAPASSFQPVEAPGDEDDAAVAAAIDGDYRGAPASAAATPAARDIVSPRASDWERERETDVVSPTAQTADASASTAAAAAATATGAAAASAEVSDGAEEVGEAAPARAPALEPSRSDADLDLQLKVRTADDDAADVDGDASLADE